MIFMKQEILATIFDMDGTMFDTERLRFRMLQEASELLCHERMTEEFLMDCLGLSATSAENLAKKVYGQDYPYVEVRKKADELELAYVREYGVPIKDGLIEVLERLKRNEMLLAVATSSKRAIAEEYLINADVMKYFDIVVCGDEVEHGKPHPEIFLKAASEINCDPKQCLIFEDSENGLLAASSAKSLPIYIKDIKEARPEIKAKAFASYLNMTDFLDDLSKVTKKLPMPTIHEHFPQNYNNNIVGIHGFGAIGGGYLSQVFSHWDGYTRPSMIIGATRDDLLRNLVNAFHKFSVYYESIAYEQTISNVHLIDMQNEEDMLNMYTNCAMIALCLPEAAIKKQANIIAKGLLKRYNAGKKPLTLLIILNKVNALNYVKKQINTALLEFVPKETAKLILSQPYFCETVVNRMVSKIPKHSLIKQIQTKLKNIDQNTVSTQNLFDFNTINPSTELVNQSHASVTSNDTKLSTKPKSSMSMKNIVSMLSDISDIQSKLSRLSIVLFHSEPDMTLYVSNHSPLLNRLRQVAVIDDISKLELIKNKLSNGTHAIIAWYSSLLGYQSIGQGMGDEQVLSLAIKLMEQEIKPILQMNTTEHDDYMKDFIANFIKRCRFSFKDPCMRVGRDPIRKLQKNERLLGTMAMAKEYNIDTPLLEYGVALGLVYALANINPDDKECTQLRELYEKTRSIKEVLTYQGEFNGKKCAFFSKYSDQQQISRIESYVETYFREKEEFLNYDHLINHNLVKEINRKECKKVV